MHTLEWFSEIHQKKSPRTITNVYDNCSVRFTFVSMSRCMAAELEDYIFLDQDSFKFVSGYIYVVLLKNKDDAFDQEFRVWVGLEHGIFYPNNSYAGASFKFFVPKLCDKFRRQRNSARQETSLNFL